MTLMPEEKPYAFISVYDKQGLLPLARALTDVYGYTLISTGGTRAFLEKEGIASVDSSEITGFGELLEGRVKSLHPELFAAILAKRNHPGHHVNFYVDTVIVNLYPFESEQQTPAVQKDETYLLDYIDVGGSALMRAAAKNYPDVNGLCRPGQYDRFLQELKLGNGKTSLSFRKQLALEAFRRSAAYEASIQHYFESVLAGGPQHSALLDECADKNRRLPHDVTLTLCKIRDLRYGENPHQQAALYGLNQRHEDFQQLHGKDLSYNNILDMEAAWAIVTEFDKSLACAIIKHNNPCGVALGRSVEQAYERAFASDPVSAFGGVVAFNCPVTEPVARQLQDVFLEVILAPAFEAAAFDCLAQKKNLRVIQRAFPLDNHHGDGEEHTPAMDIKQVSSRLFLLQITSVSEPFRIEHLMDEGKLDVVTHKKPTLEQLQDLVFAWKVVKHVKSNAIVLAKDGRTVGIGIGQTSRIGALEIALRQACDEATDAVMASDGFLPAEDNIHAAVQARISAIIHPGGSIKDPAVIEQANKYHLAMVTTGVREFRH